MSLDNIVNVTISRETATVSRAGFGTLGIIAEFATNKTTTTFNRWRTYASLTEMVEDGWLTTDAVYLAAAKVFSQNPKLLSVFIGRKDSGDANWTEALTAIQEQTNDWYVFSIIASKAATFTFDIDFVTGNLIDFTINGDAVTQVPFTTDNAGTYAAIKTQIEADITDSIVTVNATARTVIVEIFGDQVTTASVIVTAGAGQAVGTVTYINEDDFKEAAAWAETETKIFFCASSSAGIYDTGSTTDLAYFLKNLNYDRTVLTYHTSAQGDATPSYIETGWPGECLPFDVGSQTWKFKTLSAVAAYELTSSRRAAILAKNCNIYTTVAGVSITEEGVVASGEFIDIIRGIDALKARLQETIYGTLINARKIPYTNQGITAIEGLVRGVLDDFANNGFLIDESIVVNVPKLADIDNADQGERLLPDITFEAQPQGAIHKVVIRGKIVL